jgi:hypothetical protein
MANPGPTANLKGTARRSGRSGTVWRDGRQLGEVVSIEWGVEVEQIAVTIAGAYQDESKPGGETRRGTFRVQDVHDEWALRVWRFLDARRRGDRSAAAFPEFDIVTKLADIGAPADTRWQISGVQLFQYDGGHSQEDDLLMRDIPFTFREDRPLEAFEYTDDGLRLTQG